MSHRCVLLIARNHGLETLKVLLDNKKFEVLVVFTHELNPKSYDPQQKQRIDFDDFVQVTSANNIPLITIDKKAELFKLEDFCLKSEYDFLISISWRFLINPAVFKKANIGSINLHRGDLPKYAGIEPIRRALQNNEKEIVVCSHHITENYDEGEVLCKVMHQANYNTQKTLLENVERLKEEITPYFPQLTIKSLEMLITKYEK